MLFVRKYLTRKWHPRASLQIKHYKYCIRPSNVRFKKSCEILNFLLSSIFPGVLSVLTLCLYNIFYQINNVFDMRSHYWVKIATMLLTRSVAPWNCWHKFSFKSLKVHIFFGVIASTAKASVPFNAQPTVN